MNNNSLIEHKENFITRMKNFFRRIFKKEENLDKSKQGEYNETIGDHNKKDEFMDDIRIDFNKVDKVAKRANLLKEIDENEEVLNTLSISQLRGIEEYYDSVIEQNENTIKLC